MSTPTGINADPVIDWEEGTVTTSKERFFAVLNMMQALIDQLEADVGCQCEPAGVSPEVRCVSCRATLLLNQQAERWMCYAEEIES
ncbi:hypothetical protein N9937_00660 [bacterium]|nr:hypothetical protein [bacterium]